MGGFRWSINTNPAVLPRFPRHLSLKHLGVVILTVRCLGSRHVTS